MEQCTTLERARAGVDAFESVFDQYNPRICRYLCSLVGDADLAEDLAQETFLKAYKALSKAEPDNVSAWLYAIATNTALSALRRRRLISWLPLAAGEKPTRGTAFRGLEINAADRELLVQAMTRLSAPERACLLLRFQQGLSYEELADVFQSSASAAKMRLSRARAAFRDAYLQLSKGETR